MENQNKSNIEITVESGESIVENRQISVAGNTTHHEVNYESPNKLMEKTIPSFFA